MTVVNDAVDTPVASITIGTEVTATMAAGVIQALNHTTHNHTELILSWSVGQQQCLPFISADAKMGGVVYLNTLWDNVTVTIWARSTATSANLRFRFGSGSYTTIAVSPSGLPVTNHFSVSTILGGYGEGSSSWELKDDSFGAARTEVGVIAISMVLRPNYSGSYAQLPLISL